MPWFLVDVLYCYSLSRYIIIYLVVGLEHLLFSTIIYGLSSFPLTKAYFSRWLLHHQPDITDIHVVESGWQPWWTLTSSVPGEDPGDECLLVRCRPFGPGSMYYVVDGCQILHQKDAWNPIPFGKHTKIYWKWPVIVSFPIKNGAFP